jgi:hypothetical protein
MIEYLILIGVVGLFLVAQVVCEKHARNTSKKQD